MVLAHELTHANKSWFDKLLRAILPDSFFGDYDNYEERRVVTGAERNAAKTFERVHDMITEEVAA